MGAERWLCSSCGAASDPVAEPPPGCARCDAPLHLGKFGLVELLAPEQSLRVFRARESSGSREVTIRLLPEELSASLPELRQALKRFASFSHPVIAAPIDVGTHRGRTFVAEEFVPGDAVTRADLTLREGMGVMRDVALAIGAAHDKGVVHPDLRADCLKVVRGGGKTLGESGWRVFVTGFVGPGEGTVRSNLRSLGSLLYTVATGRPLGSTPPSSLNPLIDTALESILRMAMDSEGSHQPPGADAIAAELTRWLKGDAPSVRPVTRKMTLPPTKTGFDWSRIRLEARIAGAMSLALLVLILFLTFRKSDPPRATATVPEPIVASAPPVEPPKPIPVEPPKPPPPEPKPVPVEPPKPPEPKPAPVEPPKPLPPPEPKPVPVEPPKPPEPKPAPVEPPKPPPPAEPKPVPVEPPKPPEPKPAPVEPPKPPPPPEPKPIPPDPPKPPPPKVPVASSVGTLASVHAEYGMFVALNAGTSASVGEELEVVRSGKVVGRLAVVSLSAPEKRYPEGCAICKLLSGSASPGDAVRRVSK